MWLVGVEAGEHAGVGAALFAENGLERGLPGGLFRLLFDFPFRAPVEFGDLFWECEKLFDDAEGIAQGFGFVLVVLGAAAKSTRKAVVLRPQDAAKVFPCKGLFEGVVGLMKPVEVFEADGGESPIDVLGIGRPVAVVLARLIVPPPQAQLGWELLAALRQ